MGVVRITVACSDSSSSTSESSSTASCRPSTSSASGGDDDTIPTDTMDNSTDCTDNVLLFLLEKLRAPSKKSKTLRSCLLM